MNIYAPLFIWIPKKGLSQFIPSYDSFSGYIIENFQIPIMLIANLPINIIDVRLPIVNCF